MVCSNETLKVSIDDLKVAVKENTAEQQKTRVVQAQQTAEFSTWKKTMCWPHERQIKEVGEAQREQESTINRAIGKAAGIIAAVVLLMQGFGLYFAYLKIAPKLLGG